MSPNLLQYPVALFGVLRAGMTVVNVNPLYTPRELEHQLKDSGAKVIVILENFAHTLQQVLGRTAVEHVITTQVGDLLPVPKRWIVNFVIRKVKKLIPAWRIDGATTLPEALARGAKLQLRPVELAARRPRIPAIHRRHHGRRERRDAHPPQRARQPRADRRVGLGQLQGRRRRSSSRRLPLYHIFCLTSTLSFMKWGSLVVLIANPRDIPAFVKELRRWKWSVMTGVNTLFNGLLNAPGFDTLDFSGVKVVVGGGASVQEAVASRWHQVTGHYITEAYGLTETSPGVSANPIGAPWNGTIGLPFPSTELSIYDDGFNELPLWTGEGEIEKHTGELCVRGPQVMKGYWNNPTETANVMQDQWLRTGDLGHMNADGYVTITDRKKDVIAVSGFKVFPNELEGVMAMHPGVLECGVVGVPDDKTGEAVKMVIVRKDPGLTEESVIAHCKAHLTGYKRPRYVEFRDALPKTPIGKILRRELREPVKVASESRL